MNDCGCKIDYPPGYNGVGVHGYIVHCPLHANAEKMREALEELYSWVKNWEPMFMGDPDWPETQEKIDVALKELDQ